MRPRIAIPTPHSLDREYAERAIPQYEHAVEQAGGEPVRIALDQTPAEVMKIIERCDGVLLPGSKADVDPARFGKARSRHTAAADPRRDAVDDLLLDHAYEQGKPLLGICYGLQSLNVFRAGSLVQHIPDFLPEELRSRVNHEAGRKVGVAHRVEIESNSRLRQIVVDANRSRDGARTSPSGAKAQTDNELSRAALEALRPPKSLTIPVNSSHHQSADTIGKGLRVSARCPEDGIIEGLEGTDSDHFVVAVQWHPERSVDLDEPSRGIFRALIEAAAK